ncbi:hypothetical protein E4U43_005096 [Claviceps pusilla]|uniref:Uncharacterized protein n=1 Tax=Claviceps pusilla TaxID=123648 RepID=A0A9P7NGU5_9HYPO|nr:hypothetical protein E4U43_005096 [Claviceps pusilla]
MEPEELVPGLSNLHLGDSETEYEKAFDRVIEKAKELRPSLSIHEIHVTKELAGPFTKGGLLVLLLQPRPFHPWSKGLDAVIQNCTTLDALNDALRFYATDLKRDVSLLDLWVCLPEGVTNSLDSVEEEKFSELVLAAVRAKKPDCILCFGKDTLDTLEKRSEWKTRRKPHLKVVGRGTISGSLFGIPVVNARHPSFVFYHNEDDMAKTLALWAEQVGEACRIAREARGCQLPASWATFSPEPDFDPPRSAKVYRFMQLLCECSFSPNYELPEINIRKQGGFYVLEDWQTDWLKYAGKAAEDKARKTLIPIFKELNRAWEKTSWFTYSYKLRSETRISELLSADLESIEANCYILARNGVIPADEVPRRRHALGSDPEDLWDRLDKIATEGLNLWKRSMPHPRRGVYIGGFADE